MMKYTDCKYSKPLLDKILSSDKDIDISMVKKSIVFAKHYHGTQKRKSGEPFYSHPIAVAILVSNYLFTTESIVTSILHDTIEDTALTKEMIHAEFGSRIANNVQDLTRVKIDGENIITAGGQIYDLWKNSHDDCTKYEIILIKICDRIHNMMTIKAKRPEKQKKTIRETIKYFIAIAEYMEIPDLVNMLYSLCYKANMHLGDTDLHKSDFDQPFTFD